MITRDEATDLDEPKTMKISLPARLHVKLHSLKILGGVTISKTVEDAIVRYFERGDHQEAIEEDDLPKRLFDEDGEPA